MENDDQEKMEEIVADLNRYAYHYYVLDDPIISDKEYDALFDQLLQLEKATGITLPDSPTKRVGDAILGAFAPHRHKVRLWSLDKAQTYEELIQWENRISRILGNDRSAQVSGSLGRMYTVEYKYDGLTINLTYEDGYLVQAATRGNGEIGEGIREQVQTIRSIPLSIPFKGIVEIQGEGLMRLSVLEEYNKTAQEPLKNARNAAAGALRNLNPKVTASRKLDAFFYNIGHIEGAEINSQQEVFSFLQDNRFPVSSFVADASSVHEVIQIIEGQKNKIHLEDYLIDGFVVKVDSLRYRQQLGHTDRFPRWAIAFKLEASEVTTGLLDVQWNIGRTGKLTPVAILEPVEIGGVTVQRATLNNWNDIIRKRVRKACSVWLRRSNDVIPEVMGTVEDCIGGEDVEKPTVCPACGSELVEIGAHLFCQNSLSCQPQLIYRLAHFASRDGLDIEGFSVKTAEQFVREGLVQDVADIFSVSAKQMQKLAGFGKKKIQNLLQSIEGSKYPELSSFLYALGIPNIGKKTARDLAEEFRTIDRLMEASAEELLEIRDIGQISADSIVHFFSDERIIQSIRRMLDNGVAPNVAHIESKDGQRFFLDKTVVITGSFSGYSRKEITDIVEQDGGTVSSSVSRNTDLLIVGENSGSKLGKARELGIRILDESEFETYSR